MVLRKIEMIATSGFLTAPKCTKFVFGPQWGAYSAPPDRLAGLRGPTSKRKGRGGREGRERRRGE